MAESYQNGQKNLWEKEKLLVTSNFSFSHGVFKALVLLTGKNQGLFGKGLKRYILILYHSIMYFNNQDEDFKDIVGKGENAAQQHFLLFPAMLCAFSENYFINCTSHNLSFTPIFKYRRV